MRIFIAGAVSVASDKQLNKYAVYKNIITESVRNAEITFPDDIWAYREKCIRENPEDTKLEIDKMMVDYDLQCVKSSDLIVCDISQQSTGMGIELGVAYEHKIKIIFCYERGSYVSNMLTGSFGNFPFIEYDTLNDLSTKLKSVLAE